MSEFYPHKINAQDDRATDQVESPPSSDFLQRTGWMVERLELMQDVPAQRWLTRNVFAIGMLSLFSDMGHELVTAVLPLFLATFGGGAAALGAIEGFSDAASSILKLWMSHYSDRIGKRKPIMVIGYLATSMLGFYSFLTKFWQMAALRVFAWMGRGARGPVRDALLSESVEPEFHGRAFGFERGMDTTGAILGPIIAVSLVGVLSYRHIFLIAFIPGAITVCLAAFVVRDLPREAQPHLRMLTSLKSLPSAFWRYVAVVGLFGLGNFAHTLLVLHAVSLLKAEYGADTAGRIGIGLYIFHNVLYALGSYPAGAMGDRVDKRILLAIGYGLFGVMCLGFLISAPSLAALVGLFALAGIYIAIVDTVEKALAATYLPRNLRATGFGALAMVNSFGDLLSSVIVGFLWSRVSTASGFWYAAILTLLGAAALLAIPKAATARLGSS